MKNQQGSLLLELLVVIVILTLMAVGSVAWLKQRSQTLKVQNYATWMMALQEGTQAFINSHQLVLKEASSLSTAAIHGVTNPQAPSLVELRQLGFLPASFPMNNEARIWLYREGQCAEGMCHLYGVISSAKPFLTTANKVDAQSQADWLRHTNGKGLIVNANNTGWLVGGKWQIANTASKVGAVLAPGSVALLAGTKIEALDFVSQRDVEASRYLVVSSKETEGGTCQKPDAISLDKDKGVLLVCYEGEWKVGQSSGSGEITGEEINQALNYLFSQTGPFDMDWGVGKGGYMTAYIRDAIGYNYNFCVLGNPRSSSKCTCQLGAASLKFSFYSQYFMNGNSLAGGVPAANLTFHFYNC